MKFFVALVAVSAVIVLATAAPNPTVLFAPYGRWPVVSGIYGGGGSEAATYVDNKGGLSPAIGDSILGISNPGSVLGFNIAGPLVGPLSGYNNVGPGFWN